MTSPVRHFRILCLVCGEPDQAVRVKDGNGRVGYACLCGNTAVEELEMGHDVSVPALAPHASEPVACWAHAAVLMDELRRGVVYVAIGALIGALVTWLLS